MGVYSHQRVKFINGDTPARSYLKACLGHTATKACERCEIVGEKVDGTMVFHSTTAKKRTDEDFRNFKDAEYHNGISPLILLDPPIDMIKFLNLDTMHLLDEGAMYRLLEFLLDRSPSKISQNMKIVLFKSSKDIKKDISSDYKRKMRCVQFYPPLKATELGFVLRVCGSLLCKK